MLVISIANQKGGCGKTTTAINLASSLSTNDRRVLLIDLDPQAHASLGLNIESQDSIYNVISKLSPRRMKIKDIIRPVREKFDLVPSNILVGTLEQELTDEIGREIKLTEIIETIKDNYDYIIIDCPPSLGFLSVNAIRASQQVIVPVEPSRFSMQGVDRLMDIVHLIRDRLGHQVDCRVLITMFDSRLRHCFVMKDRINEKFRDMSFQSIIHINVKLKESVFNGKTVSDYDKYCRGSKDYYSLAKELMTLNNDTKINVRPLSNKMKKLIKEKTKELRDTVFVLEAPQARSVYVTGSFNDWSLDETFRMKKDNGKWVLRAPLRNGVHRYRFIIDGRWQEDPSNSRIEKNPFGDLNSIIEVKG